MSTQLLPVADGLIEYIRFGTGSPIVFINAYTADIGSWDNRFLKALAVSHEIIMFNNNHVGRSLFQSEAHNANVLAEEAYQLIQVLNLKKPTILGFSMGGMIAQRLAILHPETVGHLILINTFMPGKAGLPFSEEVKNKLFYLPRNPLKRFLISLNLFFAKGTRWQAAIALLFHRFVPKGYPIDNLPAENILTKQQALILEWFQDEVSAHDLTKIATPTLILTAENDTIVPPQNSDVLTRTIPGAKQIKINNAGHLMLFQYPEQLAAAINDFLRS